MHLPSSLDPGSRSLRAEEADPDYSKVDSRRACLTSELAPLFDSLAMHLVGYAADLREFHAIATAELVCLVALVG